MRVEHGSYYSITNAGGTTNSQQYYALKSGKDSVSFGAKFDNDSSDVNFLSKIKRSVHEFFNPKAKKLRLKEEADAEKERNQALKEERIARQKEELEASKKCAEKMLEDWNIRNSGLFQERICEDETGDIIMCESRMNPRVASDDRVKIEEPPKRGEYTLSNCGFTTGYKSRPTLSGSTQWYFRGDDSNRSRISHLLGIPVDTDEFRDCEWKMQYGYTQSKIDNSWHKCTILSSGINDEGAHDLCRYPGVNLLVEGHIPIEEMSEIKKDIVEKGLWEKFIKNQDDEALIGIYNEMLNHLNRV